MLCCAVGPTGTRGYSRAAGSSSWTHAQSSCCCVCATRTAFATRTTASACAAAASCGTSRLVSFGLSCVSRRLFLLQTAVSSRLSLLVSSAVCRAELNLRSGQAASRITYALITSHCVQRLAKWNERSHRPPVPPHRDGERRVAFCAVLRPDGLFGGRQRAPRRVAERRPV